MTGRSDRVESPLESGLVAPASPRVPLVFHLYRPVEERVARGLARREQRR